MTEPPKVKGHLIVKVAEATGKNKEDQLVWDPNFVEGFVKGQHGNDKGLILTCDARLNPYILILWLPVQLRFEVDLKTSR
jgi:hypothetical protein